MANFIKNVEIQCKSTFKSTCKSIAKLCANYKKFIQHVQNHDFLTTFPHFPTILSTTPLPLEKPTFFHFFTDPTITTINKIEERN